MAILFMEGFGGYSTGERSFAAGEEMLMNWAAWENALVINTYDSGDAGERRSLSLGGTGGSYLNLGSNTGFSIDEDGGTVCVGVRVYRGTTDKVGIIKIGEHTGVGVDTSGYFVCSLNEQYFDPAYSGSVKTSSTLTVDEWTYCEAEIVLSQTTTGSVRLYLDGTMDAESENIITRVTSADYPVQKITMLYNNNDYQDWEFTDVYVTDDACLGPTEIWYQPCDTAGSSEDFTPSAGNNEDNVDEYGSDGDTTYNESDTPGDKDYLKHSDTAAYAPAAIQPMAFVRGSGGGYTAAKLGVLSGSTESFGDKIGVPDANWVGLLGDIEETDPNTGSAWTATGVNAAETVLSHST